jgi:hypothetical protein
MMHFSLELKKIVKLDKILKKIILATLNKIIKGQYQKPL